MKNPDQIHALNPNIPFQKDLLHRVLNDIGKIILGKPREVQLALSCFLARGHLLIEDLPGVGKTTLSHALAKVLGLQYQRVQFTSDMLPADILGVSVFERETASFEFHPGPIFSELILADEVNRATPKTQSALLEAMEEQQVTIDGETRLLPTPFFVIATQNPSTQIGTFPLPESQLDRFLMKISLGYLDNEAERALLTGEDRRTLIDSIQATVSRDELLILQKHVQSVHISEALLDYLQNILQFTRHDDAFETGLSPRAGLAIKRASQAWAVLQGRDHVLPEDIQSIIIPVSIHRLHSKEMAFYSEAQLSEQLIKAVPIP